MDFANKIVVITGCARSIGRDMAREYARQGATVVMVDILRDQLLDTVSSFTSAGYSAHAHVCDIGSDAEVDSLATRVIRDIGVPDIIHNNAVMVRTGSILDLSLSDVQLQLDVNVLGYLRIMKAFIPAIISRGQGGWIANTVSPNGLMPNAPPVANMLTYSMCKAAEISLSQSAAITLQPYGIGVSILFPSKVSGESILQLGGTAPEGFKEGFADFMRSTGSPSEEVAQRLVQGVKEKRFFVNAMDGLETCMEEWTRQRLDPNADYRSIQALPRITP